MKSIFTTLMYLLPLALFTSCSSAFLTSSWTNETYTPQKFEKVLVLAIASKTSNRAAVEGAVVDEMRKQGIHAVSSLSTFPGSQNAFSDQQIRISREELADKLKEQNVDGLLVLSLLDKKVEEVYVEGSTHTQTSTINQGVQSAPAYNQSAYHDPNYQYNYHPDGYNNRYDPYYTNYYTYYETVQTTVTEPGYYENQTTLYLESNFYKVEDGLLAWSGQSEVIDAASVSIGASDWATVLVKGMIKYGAIVP